MKKHLRTLFAACLAVLMLVMLSLSVFADMSAPETKPYDVIVNPGGTVTKDGDFIPEGTVLTIKWEYYYSDDIWASTEWNGKYNVEINLADVTNGDTIPEEFGTVSEWQGEGLYQVFGENGIEVYAGPGHAYKVLFNVPDGERISGKYRVIDWIYIRYGDQGGWICPRLADVVTYYDEPVTVWVLKDTELQKERYASSGAWEENILCTIPAGTKLDSYFRSVDNGFYYVTYEGQSGWVNTFRSIKAIAEGKTKNYKATEDGMLCLFNEPFDYNEGVFDPAETLDVKKGDRFSIRFDLWSYEYLPVSWYYIESDSASGWTPVCSDEEKAAHPYSSDFSGFVNVGDEQPDDETVGETTDTLPDDVTEDETKDVEPKDVLPPEPDTNGEETKSDTNDGETEPAGFFSSPTAMIAVCAVSAVVLALVAAVVLMIIKKKKTK